MIKKQKRQIRGLSFLPPCLHIEIAVEVAYILLLGVLELS